MAQSSASYIVSITMDGWPDHTFFLGQKLQQVNNETDTSRTIRRALLMAQGLPGNQGTNQQQDELQEESQDSTGY
jgi:hypothetical protein